MENRIDQLKERIVVLTKLMEDELADLKNGKVISSEILDEKTKLTHEIELYASEISRDEMLSMADNDSFKEVLKPFLDIGAILKFELEKNIVWTNNVLTEINNFIEIKLRGVNLYSSDGTLGRKQGVDHVAPITLFERI